MRDNNLAEVIDLCIEDFTKEGWFASNPNIAFVDLKTYVQLQDSDALKTTNIKAPKNEIDSIDGDFLIGLKNKERYQIPLCVLFEDHGKLIMPWDFRKYQEKVADEYQQYKKSGTMTLPLVLARTGFFKRLSRIGIYNLDFNASEIAQML